VICKFKVPESPPCRLIVYGETPRPARRPFVLLEPGTEGELVAIANPYGADSVAGPWLVLRDELAAGRIVGHAAKSWAADGCITKKTAAKVDKLELDELCLEAATAEALGAEVDTDTAAGPDVGPDAGDPSDADAAAAGDGSGS